LLKTITGIPFSRIPQRRPPGTTATRQGTHRQHAGLLAVRRPDRSWRGLLYGLLAVLVVPLLLAFAALDQRGS
jgi:hypothetical protein